jgi:hypothetical protein
VNLLPPGSSDSADAVVNSVLFVLTGIGTAQLSPPEAGFTAASTVNGLSSVMTCSGIITSSPYHAAISDQALQTPWRSPGLDISRC